MKKKYSIIIGASRGIGQAVAVSLSRNGFETILVGRTKSGLEETATLCKQSSATYIVEGDITFQLKEIIDSIQKITNYVNVLWLGAAGFSEEPLSLSNPNQIRELIRSGYESLVEFIHLSYPLDLFRN